MKAWDSTRTMSARDDDKDLIPETLAAGLNERNDTICIENISREKWLRRTETPLMDMSEQS